MQGGACGSLQRTPSAIHNHPGMYNKIVQRSRENHVKSRQHKARRYQSLEDVVSRELGAPYTVQHFPDTGQIVLAPVAGGGGGKPYSTIPVGEDRGGGVAHPVTPCI